MTPPSGFCRRADGLVRREAEAALPTKYGDFRLVAYSTSADSTHPIALVSGAVSAEPMLVRVHSECFTGDTLGSRRCDCGEQLDAALRMIGADGGVLVYLRQEGRGIGLLNKIKAYGLQEGGLDTVEANAALGFPADMRDYSVGVQILRDLGVRRMRLLTNNPKKIVGLEDCGLEITERVPITTQANGSNRAYLATKREKLGHMLGAPE